jgi:hypothetical protein
LTEVKVEIIDERIIVRKKSSKRYINGVDLHNCLVEYYIQCERDPEVPIPSYIGQCILKLAKNLGSKANFSNYSYREEMEGDAIEKMLEAVRNQKYDASISQNPFAYFSQISWNSFLQRLAKEKKESYILHKNFENLFLSDSGEGEDKIKIESSLNDPDHNRIIGEFEKKKEPGQTRHKNLSYAPNRQGKGRKLKE